MQCQNNLKQLGLAVHTYHDANNGLIPASIGCTRGSGLLQLLPFIEQTGLWDVFNAPSGSFGAGGVFLKADGTASTVPLQGLFVNNRGRDGSTDADKLGGYGFWPLAEGMDYDISGALWEAALPGEYRNLLSPSAYLCPSRHGGGSSNLFGSIPDWYQGGTKSDYIMPAVVELTDPDAALPSTVPNGYGDKWCDIGSSRQYGSAGGKQIGDGTFKNPFIPIYVNAQVFLSAGGGKVNNDTNAKADLNIDGRGGGYPRVLSWGPGNNFSSWSDGTSNQLILGEKHVPSWAVNKADEIGLSWDSDMMVYNAPAPCKIAGNMSFYHINGGQVEQVIHFADGPNDFYTNTTTCQTTSRANATTGGNTNRCWGSAHTGVVNFALGDGVVRGVSIETDTRITYRLANISDGGVVTLP